MISIVIPNYNGEKFLPMCIDSLMSQTIKDIEIIVVDNSSADSSCSVIEEKYPDVILIKMDHNTGFSVAVNAGIKKAKGEFVALFNNDAEAAPDWLEKLYKEMMEDESLGICGCKVLSWFEREKVDSAGVCLYDDGVSWNRGHGLPDSEEFSRKEYIFGACAAAALYRMRMLDEIAIDGEYFDEDFFAYYEDADVNARSVSAGYKCLFVPDALVYHIGSATGKRLELVDGKPVMNTKLKIEEAKPVKADNIMFHYSGNYINFIVKNMPLSFFLLKLWKTAFYEFVQYFFYALRHRILPAYFKSRARVFSQLPLMLKKRSSIIKGRKVSNREIYSLTTKRRFSYYTDIYRNFKKRRKAKQD